MDKKQDEGPPSLSEEDRARLAGMDGIATPLVRQETVEIGKDTLEKILVALEPFASLVLADEEMAAAQLAPHNLPTLLIHQIGERTVTWKDYQAAREAYRALWGVPLLVRAPEREEFTPATSAWEAFCSGLVYCEGCHQTKERSKTPGRPGMSKWYCDECRGAGKDKR